MQHGDGLAARHTAHTHTHKARQHRKKEGLNKKTETSFFPGSRPSLDIRDLQIQMLQSHLGLLELRVPLVPCAYSQQVTAGEPPTCIRNGAIRGGWGSTSQRCSKISPDVVDDELLIL